MNVLALNWSDGEVPLAVEPQRRRRRADARRRPVERSADARLAFSAMARQVTRAGPDHAEAVGRVLGWLAEGTTTWMPSTTASCAGRALPAPTPIDDAVSKIEASN
jgi:hypothetical protein